MSQLSVTRRHINVPDVEIAFRAQQARHANSSLNELDPFPASKVIEEGVLDKDGNASLSFFRLLRGVSRNSAPVSIMGPPSRGVGG